MMVRKFLNAGDHNLRRVLIQQMARDLNVTDTDLGDERQVITTLLAAKYPALSVRDHMDDAIEAARILKASDLTIRAN